jgi:hypothetical protein
MEPPRRLQIATPTHANTTHEQADKASRLAALGISESLLEEGMRYSWSEMDRCSGNDVRSAAGQTGYTKPMRFLREKLLPEGWTKGGPPYGLEAIISPGRTFQIVTSSATSATGMEGQMPATKYPKGRRTADAIVDHGQLAFDVVSLTNSPLAEMKSYFWLYFVDEDGDEIRHELSVPTHIAIKAGGKRGKIDQFGSRIILDAISLNSDEIPEEEAEDAFSEDLDIQVPRRADSE